MTKSENIPILDPFNRRIGLAIISMLAGVGWLYLLYMAWAMENMHLVDMWMPPLAGVRSWMLYDFFMLFLMWVLMMVAMMLPTAIPAILVFMRIQKTRSQKQNHASSSRPFIQSPTFMTTMFISGYLSAWTFYSLLVSLMQWKMHESGLLNPMMTTGSYLLSGLVLLAAGVYQWTPLKNNCLKYCRSPLAFLLAEWREGVYGGVRMGFHHGLYCVGCCAFLMAILFAVGVMNMLWVVLLTVFIALEKTLIPPKMSSMIFGSSLSIWGIGWLALHWWS